MRRIDRIKENLEIYANEVRAEEKHLENTPMPRSQRNTLTARLLARRELIHELSVIAFHGTDILKRPF